jgi:hypothetical protein
MRHRLIFPAVLAIFFAGLMVLDAAAQQPRPAAVKAQPARQSDSVPDCGKDCSDSRTHLAAPAGGGTRDYDCASENCSCAGAKDCVDMKKICAPGTLSCNDYGCTCAQAPEPEGGGG